jgi:predicted GIY-YIG superfamily endonuclease
MKKQYNVYKFLDKEGNVLYVGKTTNIKRRMENHFTKGHLPAECYKQVCTIKCIKCESQVEMAMKEMYFINKYKPQYNTEFVEDITIDPIEKFDNIKWEEEYIKPNKIVRIEESELKNIKEIDILKNIILNLQEENNQLHKQISEKISEVEWYKYVSSSFKDLLFETSIARNKIYNIEKNPYWKK